MKDWLQQVFYFVLSCVVAKLVDNNLPNLHRRNIFKVAIALKPYLLLRLFLIRLMFTNPKKAQHALLYGAVLVTYSGTYHLLCLPSPTDENDKPTS